MNEADRHDMALGLARFLWHGHLTEDERERLREEVFSSDEVALLEVGPVTDTELSIGARVGRLAIDRGAISADVLADFTALIAGATADADQKQAKLANMIAALTGSDSSDPNWRDRFAQVWAETRHLNPEDQLVEIVRRLKS